MFGLSNQSCQSCTNSFRVFMCLNNYFNYLRLAEYFNLEIISFLFLSMVYTTAILGTLVLYYNSPLDNNSQTQVYPSREIMNADSFVCHQWSQLLQCILMQEIHIPTYGQGWKQCYGVNKGNHYDMYIRTSSLFLQLKSAIRMSFTAWSVGSTIISQLLVPVGI